MIELKAQSAFAGTLPLRVGEVTLKERALGHLTVLGALGDNTALADVLKQSHGLALPEPLRSTEEGDTRCLWFGRNEVLLIGPTADPKLAAHAAMIDVSDGWAAAELAGAGAEDVLARLVPVDLRATAFKPGHSLRSQLRDMPVSITRTEEGFLLLVYRSMAATFVRELRRAMEAVASRR